jgi:hypothetical protein
MRKAQDLIGWRRFLEGIFTKEMLPIQSGYVKLEECGLTPDKWA